LKGKALDPFILLGDPCLEVVNARSHLARDQPRDERQD
jgi:hypothetical protein